MHWLQRYCKFSWCCPAKERCKSRRQKTKLCYTRNYFRQGGDIGTTDCTISPGLIARWLCEKDASYKTGNDDLAKTLRTDFMERLKTHDITFSACHFNTSVPTLRLTANSAQGNKERKRRDTTRIRHVPMKALFLFFFFFFVKQRRNKTLLQRKSPGKTRKTKQRVGISHVPYWRGTWVPQDSHCVNGKWIGTEASGGNVTLTSSQQRGEPNGQASFNQVMGCRIHFSVYQKGPPFLHLSAAMQGKKWSIFCRQ